ncbi:hypothetical protein [Variovorax arabinosiphilus]|uniref:hypothetical protein n=1 Tax=Variovorax arabinosiphilus TaxID=3053498 RepID=UPI0025777809|nr:MULTISPECIES: hypothetical protein [unclassified Variovorax]MDM0122194.1 hypothetical protein [Variovorax sp. J2L1-78]MDM0131277.1 hypothetical protein [Variovorax sp. J2L1-63]MDM0234957.1 hypothetical protein [Variovorax sp. J2R1-6]
MTPKDVDVRGFAYAMEPAWLRQQWQVDRSMAALARAEKALDDIDAELDAVRRLHDAGASEAAESMHLRLDPTVHRRTLAYLSMLGERMFKLQVDRSEREKLCLDCRKDCMAQQLRLEALNIHRDDALAEFANDLRLRNATEQDRDWLSRSLGRATSKGEI